MDPRQIFALLAAHYLGDFIFQTHEMSCKKKDSLKWLTKHVFVYSIVMYVITSLFVFQSQWEALSFCFLNATVHWSMDSFTSIWSARYFNKDWHMFFVVIGLDQLIHIGVMLWLIS